MDVNRKDWIGSRVVVFETGQNQVLRPFVWLCGDGDVITFAIAYFFLVLLF